MGGDDELDLREAGREPPADAALPVRVEVGVDLVDEDDAGCDDLGRVVGGEDLICAVGGDELADELEGEAEDRAEAVAELIDVEIAVVGVAEADPLGVDADHADTVREEVAVVQEVGEALEEAAVFSAAHVSAVLRLERLELERLQPGQALREGDALVEQGEVTREARVGLVELLGVLVAAAEAAEGAVGGGEPVGIIRGREEVPSISERDVMACAVKSDVGVLGLCHPVSGHHVEPDVSRSCVTVEPVVPRLAQRHSFACADEREGDGSQRRALSGGVITEQHVPAGARPGLPDELADAADVLDLDAPEEHGAGTVTQLAAARERDQRVTRLRPACLQR